MRILRSLTLSGVTTLFALTTIVSPLSVRAESATGAPVVTATSIVEAGATSTQLQTVFNGKLTNDNAGTLDNVGTPIGDQAYFRAGSITKPFIATTMMQLVDEGKINLDAPIDTYLPGRVIGGDTITTRQLLSHRSGLQEYLPSLPLYNLASYPSTPAKIQEMLDAAYNTDQLIGYINSRPLASTPGTTFSYANSNYVVAGEIISKVTHKSYAKNIEERILNPLGMNHTRLPGTDRNLPEPAAHGYEDLSDPTIGGVSSQDMATYNGSQVNAAGEIVTTTGDLNLFTKALISGKLMSNSSFTQMVTPISDMGDGTGYGLGIMTMQTSCGPMIGHGGNIYGYASQAYSSPDGSKQVAISGTEGKLGYVAVTLQTTELAKQAMCR